MPNRADVISIQEIHGEVFLWARVDTEQPKGRYTIRVKGTGHDLEGVSPENHIYAGTVVMSQPMGIKPLVWHFFLFNRVTPVVLEPPKPASKLIL